MIFAVDIGNTNIVIGVFDKNEIVFTSRISTDYQKLQMNMLQLSCYYLKTVVLIFQIIRGVIISSVVPTACLYL